VAVATGRAEIAADRAVGVAIEHAAQRIRARQRLAGERVDIDDLTAGMLDLRFDVTMGPLGPELAGELDVAESARVLLGRPTPFVGREREMAMLEALLAEQADEPDARAVLVIAAAGAGKSRLRHEIIERLRARGGVEIWIARGDPMHAGASFGLLAQLVRRAARLAGGEPVEARRQKLLARVSRHVPAPDRLRVAEFLGELSGTPFSDEGRVELRAARQDLRLLGDQVRRAWVDFVGAEAAACPLVIVLEDLHWGDAPSAEGIDAALRHLDERALLVLGFARPDVHDRLPRLWQEHVVLQLRLNELPRRACDRLAREVLGERATPEFVARLWERSGGNAFFLEELLRAAAAGGVHDLPETMLAMIESRLDALDVEGRRLLRAASVFGGVFWRGGLVALLGEDAALDARLARLVAEEWIERRPSTKLGGEEGYAFRHALVREAAYGTLTTEDRALGHRLAGAWLEAAGEASAMVLVEHYELGGAEESAVRWCVVAAEKALEGDDLPSVLACVDRAIVLHARDEALGRLALVRALAHNWRGEHADGELWASRASEALPVGSAWWCTAMGQWIWAVGSRGDGERLVALEEKLLASSVAAPGPQAIASSFAVGWLLNCGRYEEARSLLGALDPLVTRLKDEPAVAAAALSARSMLAAFEGDLFSARELLTAVITSAQEAGDRRQVCLQQSNLAELCNHLGAYAEAEEIARACHLEAGRIGVTVAALGSQHNLGLALTRRGALAEARETLAAAIAGFAASEGRFMEGATRVYLAEALRCAGDLGAAEAEARCAMETLSAFRPHLSFAMAVLADIMLGQGRVSAAREQAKAAFDLLQELGQVQEGEALVRVVYAEVLDASGDHAAARDVIAVARDRLLARVACIGSETWRRSFLENIPENARTLALAERWGAAGGNAR
jgi:tetratricopeptide (TPR) repeat protein